ncbi:MAG TPA: copper transporter [Micromonosporaceae bacterium]|nr:copper transporter [Micromonosporaceae bacterium]
MINFRYHVVSLTAVFLALAIGLVVGTAALNGPMADSLNDSVNALGKDNKNLREQVGHLQKEVNQEEDFVEEAAPRILDGSLTSRRVLVVTLPNARDHVDGVIKMLTTAGAEVTARVDVEDKFTNPENGVELLDLADQAAVPSVPVATLPGNSDGVEKSAALLGAVLLDRSPAVVSADVREVLAAYEAAGYISVDDKVSGPAEVVVVVAGLPYTDRESAKKNQAVVTTLTQFDEAGRIVVAGSAVAGDGNAVSSVRGDPTLSKTISTVDNAGTAQGQLVTALAVAEQILSGTGHYGIGAGAESLMPRSAA